MLGGIIAIREMNARVVRETGFTCAEEILYPKSTAALTCSRMQPSERVPSRTSSTA